MMRAFEKLMAPLKRRLALMITRAVVDRVNDGQGLQRLQLILLAGEVADDVERLQPLGLTAVPEAGAEALAVAVGGNRSHLLVIGCEDRRKRPKGLAAGEVMLYGLSGGSKILLKADGTVEITPGASGKMIVNGGIEASGDIKDAAGTMQAMRGTYNGHDHLETGGTTNAPLQQM